MGDKKIDQRLNLDEIKETLKQINTKLENIGGNMQVDESERKVDALFIQIFYLKPTKIRKLYKPCLVIKM